MQCSGVASNIRSKINDTYTQSVDHYEPEFSDEEDGGTSHGSIIAPDGSAVAITCYKPSVSCFYNK